VSVHETILKKSEHSNTNVIKKPCANTEILKNITNLLKTIVDITVVYLHLLEYENYLFNLNYHRSI